MEIEIQWRSISEMFSVPDYRTTAGDQRASTAKKGRHQRHSTPKPKLSGEENLVEDGGWRVFFAV